VVLSEQDDPDWVFAWMQRYAAQVRIIDAMLDVMVASTTLRRARWVIAGTSGFSLGQNGRIGHRIGPIRSPEIRLPLVVSTGGPLRVPTLESADGFPDLLQRLAAAAPLVEPEAWFAGQEEFAPQVRTDSDRAACAVTSPKWFLTESNEPAESPRLFLKPDDTDDVNDVARLRRDVVDTLASADHSAI